MEEMRVWSPGREDPLEEGMAAHSGILAWRIPWTEEPGGLQSIGLQRVRHDRSDLAHTLLVYSYNLDIITNNAYFDFQKCLSLKKICDMWHVFSNYYIFVSFHFLLWGESLSQAAKRTNDNLCPFYLHIKTSYSWAIFKIHIRSQKILIWNTCYHNVTHLKVTWGMPKGRKIKT